MIAKRLNNFCLIWRCDNLCNYIYHVHGENALEFFLVRALQAYEQKRLALSSALLGMSEVRLVMSRKKEKKKKKKCHWCSWRSKSHSRLF